VTGAGAGIGRAVAQALVADGYAVALAGRRVELLQQAAASVDAAGSHTLAVPTDVRDPVSAAALFAQVEERFGRLDLLFNNAGVGAPGVPLEDLTLEEWQTVVDINLTGAFLCTQQVLADMLAAGDGRIINIASTSGLKGYRNIAAYCASKHGLIGMTRALAAETARSGVTVNAVCPAYTDTDMAARAVDNIVRDMQRTEEEARSMIARSNPLGRLIRPEEVAAAVAWLCSPPAAAMTGQAIAVAGGEV
jgi:NAD(P)-dependent dehydrogenase (short-subunit alcohol dehydrogenase family)